jgi:hypothetical protein
MVVASIAARLNEQPSKRLELQCELRALQGAFKGFLDEPTEDRLDSLELLLGVFLGSFNGLEGIDY